MAKTPKAVRVPPTEGARVHLRGRNHLGSGIINSIAPNGTWCSVNWDTKSAVTDFVFPKLVHIDELETAET